MRLNITLKSENKNYLVPFNYNHILSSIIYDKISDLDLASKLHDSNNFKFFNFSQINVRKRKFVKNGIISRNGEFSFIISSPNDYLIRSLVDGYLSDRKVRFHNDILNVNDIELLPMPSFDREFSASTLSPILVRTKKMVDGDLKVWDLAPGDMFFNKLNLNLIKKFNSFYNSDCSADFNVYSEMKNVKRKRITVFKDGNRIFNRGYMMDLILEGDADLLKFAYDCGLGEKNSMGFGLFDLIGYR